MRLRIFLIAGFLAVAFLSALHAQREFREYPAVEYNNFPLPPDYRQKAEFTRARLIYPTIDFGFGRRMYGSRWSRYWTMDYPRSDRHLLAGIRRLTRIDTRSVEQPVDLMDPQDPNDVYNWPFLYAVEVGHWELTDEQCKKLRDFIDRGGFFMCDDFHGTREWAIFVASMNRVFPDRPIVEIPNDDAIFHTVYDLDKRFQVPGAQWFDSGVTYEHGGIDPEWRGIYDTKGRLVAAICHNMDLGDAWEWSDDPRYPEKWASLAYRIAVNYVMYDMTH
ncbi:MAG: DUF4159 domain-containing protein [Bryobacteraceae bacterium]